MADLDDFDLDPSGEEPPIAGPQPPRSIGEPEGGGLSFLVILSALVVVALGGVGVLWYAFRSPVVPQPTPQVATSAEVTPAPGMPAASPTPPVHLPALDESDAIVRQLVGALTTHPEAARWLAQSALVRTLTAVVVNVVDGETPVPHLGVLKPKKGFEGVPRGRRLVADATAFGAYATVVEVVASLDGKQTAETFGALEPLFDAAYRDLGHPEGGFRKALVRAMEILEATPVPKADETLERNGTLLRYADPRFEGLTPAQKQFLRMGPDNVGRVQEALGRLRAHLVKVQS